jgi:hypothetical protein
MPWWTADIIHYIRGFIGTIEIYSYGLSHTLVELAEYIAADETPFYQTVLAWIYLAASIGLLLLSTWLKGRKGRWLLGGIGLIYIAYASIAVIWVAIRTGDFDISLQGWSTIGRGMEAVNVFASLQFGYYLAYGAGLMCIAMALLRNIIVGKPKLSAYNNEQVQVQIAKPKVERTVLSVL